MSSYPSDRAVFWTATRYLMNCTIIQWASWQVLYFIACLLFITCKHDMAACGKDGSWFLWERPFFTPLQRRNYGITRYQIYLTNVDVGQRKRIAELGSNWIHGSDSLCGWIIQLQILVSFLDYFLLLLRLVPSTHLQTAIRHGFGRLVAQKTWFGARICLLSVRIATTTSKGFKISKNCSGR